MKVTTSKSKNAESLKKHGPTRDDVMEWARAEAKLETQKYKEEKTVNISFNPNKRLQPQQQVFYRGGYLFLQYFLL